MAVDVTHGMTARDIVAKLQKRSRLNKDLIKRRVSGTNFSEAYFLQSQVRTASPVDELQVPESDQNEDVRLGEQFVFEVGGNIGKQCDIPTLYILFVSLSLISVCISIQSTTAAKKKCKL